MIIYCNEGEYYEKMYIYFKMIFKIIIDKNMILLLSFSITIFKMDLERENGGDLIKPAK